MIAGEHRITNAELAVVFGKVDTRLTVIEGAVGRIEKSLNGNGHDGLLKEFDCLKVAVEHHVEEDEKRMAQKDKWSARTWAVVLAIIGAVIGQTVALITLYIRTGGIR